MDEDIYKDMTKEQKEIMEDDKAYEELYEAEEEIMSTNEMVNDKALLIKNFMNYAAVDINKLLFEFQDCTNMEDFMCHAQYIKSIALHAVVAYCRDKEQELASEKRWEKVDKSEAIYAKKKEREWYSRFQDTLNGYPF